MAVTLRDVAKDANVAMSTVSYVLSGSGLHKVSDDTCQRILESARRLHYRPNLKARGLSKGRTYIAGALFRQLNISFVPEIIEGLEQVLEENGYCLILATYASPREFTDKCNYLYQHGVEGVAVLPLFNDVQEPDIGDLAIANIPLISIGGAGMEFPKVLVEPHAVGRTAFTYLAEMGHRNIAYAGNYPSRIHGMRFAQKKYPDVKFTWNDDPVSVTGDGESIFKFVMSLDPRPTAVLADCDIDAIAFMHCALRNNFRIPEDFSVVGIDGLEIGAYASVPLTSVGQPTVEQGRQGGKLLLDAMNGKNIEDCILQPFMIERESCRKI